MRDEMDARIWNDSHRDFTNAMDGALNALAGALRFGGSRAIGTPIQLASLFAAFSLTGLTLIVGAAIA